MAFVTLYPAQATQIKTGGTPVTVMYGPVQGGMVVNPLDAGGQGIASPETLFIDIVNPAALSETATTIPLAPGQSFTIPPGQATNVSVNAATAGHQFSAVVIQPATAYPPASTAGAFPPAGPTNLTAVIPSYLYQQYADDDALQAFVSAYNGMAQQYVDWFNQVNLPIYTQDPVAGPLLDWVAQGLYGITRQALPTGNNQNLGQFNTYTFNTLAFNVHKNIGPQNVVATTDDIFRRIITWNFLKGDGNVFNIRWLKRRVMRFLYGTNGINYPVDQTYQVSVTFGVGNQVNINLISGGRSITGGAVFNRFAFNVQAFNGVQTRKTSLIPLPNVAIFKQALQAGVLNLPFQFSYIVNLE